MKREGNMDAAREERKINEGRRRGGVYSWRSLLICKAAKPSLGSNSSMGMGRGMGRETGRGMELMD